jgi:phosphoglycerate dehydrogenase-like enzyme
MSPDSPLVVLVAYGPLGDVIDPARLDAIRADVDLRFASYDLSHAEQTRRDREPHAPDLADGEIALSPELRDALASAEVMLTMNAPLDLPTLAPRLQWIQAMGSGVGHLEPSRLPDGKITLTNAAGVAAAPIAEWVLARILQVYKRLDEHDAQQRAHVWQQSLGALLEGRTVVVVGTGAIGSAVATRLQAFGVHVIGVRRTPGLVDGVDEIVSAHELLAVLADAHIVVVAAPSTPDTDNMFDEEAFAAMQRGAVFVNVARGPLVDENALIAALESGHLRAAAIDVARQEPLPPDSPLWDTPNLAISPHSSASADRYLERVAELFYDNLARYVAGQELRNVVDLSQGY